MKSDRRIVVFATMLALLWGQLAFAAHDVSHIKDDASDPCSICLQLDRVDGVAPSALPLDFRTCLPSLPVELSFVYEGAAPSPYESRGPPIL